MPPKTTTRFSTHPVVKVTRVDDLADDLANSPSVVAIDYRGLTAEQLAALRALLHGEAEVTVVKNTLARLAFAEVPPERTPSPVVLVGPTALVFSPRHGNPAALADRLRGFAREHKALTIKGAVVQGRRLDGEAFAALADLKSVHHQYTRVVTALTAIQSRAARVFAALAASRSESEEN